MSTNNDGEICLLTLNRAELRDAVRQVIDEGQLGSSRSEAELTELIESVLDQYDVGGVQSWTEAELTELFESLIEQYDFDTGQEIDVDQLKADLRADLHDDLQTTLLAELQETQLSRADIEDVVYQVLDEASDGGFGEGGYGDGGFGGDPDRLDDLEARIDALEAREPAEPVAPEPPDLSEYATRDEVSDLIDARLREMDFEGGGASFPPELREEFEHRAAEFRFPARVLNDVDPQDHPGRYHSVDHWGLDFEVKRPCHIHSAVVDAEETGTFTVVLNRYLNDAEEIEVVDSTEVSVDEAGEPVRVDLGFDVPEEGRYHLTRDGDFPLWRGEYSNWDENFVDGMKVNTGAKPDSLREGGYNDEDYWYYYYALEVTATENHEFER